MRLATSSDLPDGLITIRRDYSYADTLEAHLALDALEEARDILHREAARKAKRKRPRKR
jgi:hypothetical protein